MKKALNLLRACKGQPRFHAEAKMPENKISYISLQLPSSNGYHINFCIFYGHNQKQIASNLPPDMVPSKLLGSWTICFVSPLVLNSLKRFLYIFAAKMPFKSPLEYA